jgi:hypothetical protein
MDIKQAINITNSVLIIIVKSTSKVQYFHILHIYISPTSISLYIQTINKIVVDAQP